MIEDLEVKINELKEMVQKVEDEFKKDFDTRQELLKREMTEKYVSEAQKYIQQINEIVKTKEDIEREICHGVLLAEVKTFPQMFRLLTIIAEAVNANKKENQGS